MVSYKALNTVTKCHRCKTATVAQIFIAIYLQDFSSSSKYS